MSAIEFIDVCICTYRRNSITDTIASVAMQKLPQHIVVRIVISDNDDLPSAADLVRRHCTNLGLEYRYVHAPAHNISVARNAALDHAPGLLIAFIDDDEIASPGWLAALIECRNATGASIVLGPVQAVYGDGPKWLDQADLHSTRPAFRQGNVIDTGYTCNVLLDRGAMTTEMRQCRFDPALGRSGGEDTLFFNQLYSLGARCAFTEAALVHESVPVHRGRLRWLLKRSFRSGQTHARVLLAAQRPRPGIIVTAGLKFGYCVTGMAIAAASPAGWRRMAVRAALHAGVIGRAVGVSDLNIY